MPSIGSVPAIWVCRISNERELEVRETRGETQNSDADRREEAEEANKWPPGAAHHSGSSPFVLAHHPFYFLRESGRFHAEHDAFRVTLPAQNLEGVPHRPATNLSER